MRKEKRKREKKRKEEFFKEQNSSRAADNTMKKWGDAKRGTEVLQFRENRWRNVHGNNKLFGKRTGKKITFGKKRKCSSISGLNIERNILKPIESKKDWRNQISAETLRNFNYQLKEKEDKIQILVRNKS